MLIRHSGSTVGKLRRPGSGVFSVGRSDVRRQKQTCLYTIVTIRQTDRAKSTTGIAQTRRTACTDCFRPTAESSDAITCNQSVVRFT